MLVGLQFSYRAIASQGIVENVSESTAKNATATFLREKFDKQRKWAGSNAISLYISEHKGKPFCIIVDAEAECVMECLLCNDSAGFKYFVSNCTVQPGIVYVGIDDWGQELAEKYFPNATVMVDEYRLESSLDSLTETVRSYLLPDLICNVDLPEEEMQRRDAQFLVRSKKRLLLEKRSADSERAGKLFPNDRQTLDKILSDFPDMKSLDEAKHACRALYREQSNTEQEAQLQAILKSIDSIAADAPYKQQAQKVHDLIARSGGEILTYIRSDKKTEINCQVHETLKNFMSSRESRAKNITWKNLRGLICYGSMAHLYKKQVGVNAEPESVNTDASGSVMNFCYLDAAYKPKWKTFATIQEELRPIINNFSLPLDVVREALLYDSLFASGNPSDAVENVRVLSRQEISGDDDAEEAPLDEVDAWERVQELEELGEEFWSDEERDFVAEYYNRLEMGDDDMPSCIYFKD